jgi:hypothetical protein
VNGPEILDQMLSSHKNDSRVQETLSVVVLDHTDIPFCFQNNLDTVFFNKQRFCENSRNSGKRDIVRQKFCGLSRNSGVYLRTAAPVCVRTHNNLK